MTLRNCIALTAVLGISFQSCKKNDSSPAPTPTPIVKPDTLSTGWTKKIIPNEDVLADVFFNSATTGYLLGSRTVYRTTDGGINWISSLVTAEGHFNAFMTPDNKAFFVGDNNRIARTTDGGNSFVNFVTLSIPQDIFFTDNNNGFSVGLNHFYYTTDGGLTWPVANTTGLPSLNNYCSLFFINNTTGWIASQAGIHRTNGSHLNWQQSTVTGGTATFFYSIYATSPSIIYAASGGEIFKSINGGISFSFICRLPAMGYTDIHFLSDLVGYACAERFVFKTTDGGNTWSKVVSLGEAVFGEIHFTDADHGWACASKGTVLTFNQ